MVRRMGVGICFYSYKRKCYGGSENGGVEVYYEMWIKYLLRIFIL